MSSIMRKVSIKRVRELRIQIQNELRERPYLKEYFSDIKEHGILDAKSKNLTGHY